MTPQSRRICQIRLGL